MYTRDMDVPRRDGWRGALRRAHRMAALAATAVLVGLTVAPDVEAQGGEPTPIPNGGYVVRGRVWIDVDRDGLQDAGDGGIKQVEVRLINVATLAVVGTKESGPDGKYEFTQVPTGTYMLRFSSPTIDGGPTNWEFTAQDVGHDDKIDSDVDAQGATPPFMVPAGASQINANGTDVVMDAGNIRLNQSTGSGQCADAMPMSLGGTIWRDIDRDGHQGTTPRGIQEPGIAGVELQLWSYAIEENGVTILHRADTRRRAVTDATGSYRFQCLPEGSYYAAIGALNGFSPTEPFVQALNNINNDQNFYDTHKTTSVHPGPERFLSMVIALTQGQPNPNWTLDGGFSCDAPDPEVDLMLVIDRSRSMQTQGDGDEFSPSAAITASREAAKRVVQAMSLPPQRVGLIRFNGSAEVLAPLAPEAGPTLAYLDYDNPSDPHFWAAFGSTNIAAALDAAQAQLLQPGHEAARKVVFLWTDGDNTSEEAARAKAAELRSAGIEVFVFGITAPDRSLNESLLEDLAFSDSHLYLSGSLTQNALDGYRRVSPWACPDPMLAGETPIPCDATRGLVDLGTGAGGNRQAGPAGEDTRWKVVPPAPSTGRAASIVDPPAAGWAVLPASQWIGPDSAGNGPSGTYDYLSQFDLPGFVSGIRLFMNMRGDDEILSIKVNGQAVDVFADGAGGPSGEPRTLTIDQPGTFNLGGLNELRITVRNAGGQTGFDATGALQYCSAITGDSVIPGPLGDTPKILAIRANGIHTTGQEPTTGFSVRLLADVFVPPNVRLTSCVYSGDGIQQQSLTGQVFGAGSGIRQDCNARFDLMRGAGPHPLTYGQKSATLTIRYVNDATGAVGEIQRSGTYKAFFEKDGHDTKTLSQEPNWFTYWRDDGAVPDLKNPAVSYGGTRGQADGLFDDTTMTVKIFDSAATANPFGFFRQAAGSCPGVDVPPEPNPLDNLAQVVAHELKHLEIDRNWEPGGIWRTADPVNPDPANPGFWRDSDDQDHPNKKDGVSQSISYDDIPDNVEIASGLDPNDVFSCGAGSNDNEILAYRAKLGVHGIPSRDWANPGSKTSSGAQGDSGGAPGHPLLGAPTPDDGSADFDMARCLGRPWACGASSIRMLARLVEGGTAAPASAAKPKADAMEADLRTGAFTGAYAHRLVDLDGDGLADRLDFDVGLDGDGGTYGLWAHVSTPNGVPIYVSADDLMPPAGLQTLTLSIDGRQLSRMRVDGAYRIEEIQLSMPDAEGIEPVVLDVATDAYTTPALQAADFEPPDVQILGQYTDTGIDGNADGVLEALKVGVGLTAHAAGSYAISGVLDTGHDKVLATATVTLTTGTHLVGLSFPGGGVFRTRDDGTYRLESVRIQNASRAVVDAQAPDYATATYHHRQFAQAAVDLDVSNATDVAFKANPGAAANEVLEVAFGLNGLDQAVGYHVVAELRDDQYLPIARGGAYINEAVARAGGVRVAFAGSHIQGRGADGPYTVSLTLFDGAGNVVDALPVAHVTAPYNADDFVAPPFEILGIAGEQPVDADNDAVPEALAVGVVVMPHVTGDLTLMAGLDDPLYRTVALGNSVTAVTAGTATTVFVSFDGAQIARYGATRPLTMRGLSGWMVEQPGQTVHRDQAHTIAYDVSQFGSLSPVGGGTPGGGVTVPGGTPTAGVIAPTPTPGGPHVP